MKGTPRDILPHMPDFVPVPPSEEPEISLKNIGKRYGDKVVLEKFNLEINPGEFITAIGSSGCGKTTVLKLINGLLSPDMGTVHIQGKAINSLDQNRLRRTMGYVIQGVGLFPHMRIRDNIAYVLHLEGMDKKVVEERLEEMLDVVRLDRELLVRYPHELSGGQRQRVGLARALAARPGIILMDEPFGAVDDITRKALQQEVKTIHRQLGVTIFFITHDIHEALELGTRVLVMDKGAIEQFDTPECIRQQPATPFVQALTGGVA